MSLVRKIVITVNCNGANALNHGKFKKFLSDVDADYGVVVMFNAVRRLSRAACVKDSMTSFQRLICLPKGRKRSLSLAIKHEWLIWKL